MKSDKSQDIVICGAGIAGVASAYYLSKALPDASITLMDRQQPLSLTTACSGENFRDYWPQACMASFSLRSIELMQELVADGSEFGMKFSGYDFISESAQTLFPGDAQGLLTNRAQIRSRYPYLSGRVTGITHINNAGAFDVYALGSTLLRAARTRGVELLRDELLSATEVSGSGFSLHLASGRKTHAKHLVLAAGPFNSRLLEQFGVDLPIENFLQHKFVIPDPLQVIPRDMPFTIIADAQQLQWNNEERELIESDHQFRWLLGKFPAGLHIKPEGTDQIKLGWAYNRVASAPLMDPFMDDEFPAIVMRGAARYIPGLKHYVESMPMPITRYSGYYTRTADNWPLIGPAGPQGLFLVGALSGFGTMVGCAAGELLTACLTGSRLPDYARHFDPGRYADPLILTEINSLAGDGQL